MRNWKWLFILILPSAITVSADSNVTIPMVKHSTATFYVSVTIGDQLSEEFVIDTGASHVTISDETLGKLLDKQQAVFMRSMTGILADGSSIKVPVYRISSLKVGSDCLFNDVEVAVIKGGARSVLGLSVLSRAAPFTFHTEPPQLQLSNCSAA